MRTIIETAKSFLRLFTLIFEDNFIKTCVEEVDDKLIVKPRVYYYGKAAVQHRDIGFFSDKSIGYYYSGQLTESIPLTKNLSILLDSINKYFEADFNGILVNKYNDGTEYVGAHSDDEKFLDKIGVVALSYGAVRKFRIRDKKTKKIIMDIPTNSTEIIHMGGNFQKEFTHEIPIEKKIKEIRYSFTFRKNKI